MACHTRVNLASSHASRRSVPHLRLRKALLHKRSNTTHNFNALAAPHFKYAHTFGIALNTSMTIARLSGSVMRSASSITSMRMHVMFSLPDCNTSVRVNGMTNTCSKCAKIYFDHQESQKYSSTCGHAQIRLALPRASHSKLMALVDARCLQATLAVAKL